MKHTYIIADAMVRRGFIKEVVMTEVVDGFTIPELVLDDGGRADAGFKGDAGDCGVRAIAIVTGEAYGDVYRELRRDAKEWPGRGKGAQAIRATSPRTGIYREQMHKFMSARGWKKVSGRMRLDDPNLPKTAVLSVRKHFVAIVDGVIHDTFDSRFTQGGMLVAKPGGGYEELKSVPRTVFSHWVPPTAA